MEPSRKMIDDGLDFSTPGEGGAIERQEDYEKRIIKEYAPK